MRALLDVNVLIALLDEAHVHHRAAGQWLAANIDQGWASCPLTQLGCIRILSQPAYPGSQPVTAVARRLAAATRQPHHEFWPAELDPLADGVLSWPAALSARHSTNLYLLALAVRRDGRFVTFDRHVPLHAVPQAEARHLQVIV